MSVPLADELRGAGYHVALEVDQSSEPDAIVCALGQGGDFAACLQGLLTQFPEGWHFIVISPCTDAHHILHALRSGASDYLVYPLTEQQVLSRAIERCGNQRTLLYELQDSRTRLEQANRELQNTVQVLEQDQQAGHQAQLRMLPASPLAVSDLQFSHRIVPSLYLSGDFTDYFAVGDRYAAFFIADVSGHGSASGFCTVLLKNLFARKRSHYQHQNDLAILNPVQMVKLANEELLATGTGKYATMIVGLIDLKDRTLRYTVAGHLPLPLLYSEGKAQYLGGEGMPAGLIDTLEPLENTIDLPDVFSLGLFSDGILEVIKDKELLEKEQYLLQLFSTSQGSVDALLQALDVSGDEAAPDDIAALFVKGG